MDEEAKQRLLDQRKLSLVVDLDLTIIHASVDPTIGEWQRDETSPNHAAVADVRSFELYDDALHRDVSYYIKLRPHLTEFLSKISQLYELHIYTMGTRSYADNIAKIVDPDKKLFGDRILSRTETPGEDSKNLRKIFPVDNRMVVIIDDRADVWKWSNYLVRVQPFNFFVGIGDINSSFLPNQDNLMDTMKNSEKQLQAAMSTKPDPDTSPSSPGNSQATNISAESNESALDQLVSMQEGNDSKSIERKTAEQDENLAAQLNERPLLQLQKSLEKAEEDETSEQVANEPETNGVTGAASPPKVHHHLLKDDDEELVRIQDLLVRIQENFYVSYDEMRQQHEAKSKTQDQAPGEVQPLTVPDVKDVIEPLRSETLRGAYIVFTRMVPLDVDIYKTRWADMAMKLGAVVQTEISKQTTHVVAKPGDATSKMRQAAARGIRVVAADWLWDSSAQWWTKVDEAPYLISVDPGNASKRKRDDDINAAIEVGKDSDDEPEYDHDESRLGLKIHAETNGVDGEDDDDERPQSPVGDIHDASWDNVFDDDDDDDGEDLSDDDDSELDQDQDRASDISDSSQLSTGSSRGMKRKHVDVEGVHGNGPGNVHDSMLQKRKRQALARSSSLTNVRVVEPTPPPVGDPTEENRDAVEDGLDGDDVVGDEDDPFEQAMREALAEQESGDQGNDDYAEDDGG